MELKPMFYIAGPESRIFVGKRKVSEPRAAAKHEAIDGGASRTQSEDRGDKLQ